MQARDYDVSSQRGSNKRPPLGVKIYCVLGVLALLILLFRIPMMATLIPGIGGIVAALVATVMGTIHAVALVGLWRVVSWGWMLAVGLHVLSVLLNVFTVNVIGLALSVLVLAYLFSVREHYMGS